MADSKALRETQKNELIGIIKQQLSQDNPPLSVIVQEAARLALICQQYALHMLFKAHLSGRLPNPNPEVPSIFYDAFREKITQDFQADRLMGNIINHNSLPTLEFELQEFQGNINKIIVNQENKTPRSELIWDRKIEYDNIFMNIRERVETFIAELESPLPKLDKAIEIVGSESPMRKDGRIFYNAPQNLDHRIS